MSQQTPTQRVLFARRFIPALLVLFGVFSLLLLNFRSSHLVQAATSNTINFQARLETSSGAIAADGNYNVEFKLYNAASAGTAEWTEDYTYNSGSGGTDARVRVANGYLSVSLGSITPFPNTIDWTQPQWITMNIGGTVSSGTITWDGEMSPRLQLTAVPYAFASGQLQTTSGSNTSTLSIQAPTGGSQTFQLQNQGAAGTYNLLTQNASTGIATLGTASTLTGSLAFANAGSANTITLTTAAETVGNATITIPNTAGANDTVCLLTLANCGGSLSLGTYSTTNTDAHGATLSAGVLTFQNASATAPGMVGTGTQTFAGNKTFSGSTTLNNTTLAAGTSITITGGNTASRPASPTEGMVYYDTSTHSLLVYSNGKWQADRSTATKIVGMGTATGCTGTGPVASSNADAADFVSTSCTSSQNTINSAIAALPAGGGTVYLMEGTYIIDGTINLPGNVTLTGAGPATIIKLKDGINANINAITNAANGTSGLTASIANLTLDGNKANNSSGTQYGIAITTATNSTNFNFSNISVNNFLSKGINANASVGKLTITNSTISNNGGFGLDIRSGTISFNNLTVTGNSSAGINSSAGGMIANSDIESNASDGIDMYNTASTPFTITNNYIKNNTGTGLHVYAVNNNVITGNYLAGNTNRGIDVFQSASNTITGNTIVSGGSSGIYLANSADKNTISGNKFSITAGDGITIGSLPYSPSYNNITGNNFDLTGSLYGINVNYSGVTGTYLANNNFNGSTSPLRDVGTGTIYANQQDANGNLINKSAGGGFAIGTSTINGTLSLQGGVTAAALSAPAAPTLANVGTAGSISYTYAVTALDGTGETLASTTTTIATGNATLSGTNYIKVTFSPVAGATSYKVYRTASGGSPATTGYIGTVTSTGATSYTFNDTGLAASGSTPAANTTGGGTFAGTLQGASGTLTSGTLTLGTASTSTGSIKFFSSAASGSVTLTLNNPGTGNYTLSIPTLTGNDTICTVGAANCSGGGSGVTTVGGFSPTSLANGASISGTTITFGPADGTNPGMVTTGTQSFAGAKSFLSALTASSGILTGSVDTASVGGTLNLGTANATTIYIGSQSTNPAIGISGSTTFYGTSSLVGNTSVQITSSTAFQVQNASANTVLGVNTSANQVLFGKASTVNGSLLVYNSTNANTVTLQSGATSASYAITLPTAIGAAGQCLAVSSVVSTTANLGFTTCGSGVTTVGTFSATSIANGASISGSTITFGPADGTNPGMVTTGPQSFAGAKTFTGGATVATTSTTAFQIQTTGGSSTLLTANTSSMRISIGSIGTSTGQLYVSGTLPTGTIGSATTGASPYGAAVQGRYAYVVNHGSNSLQIFDVSNPASPVSVGSVSTGSSPDFVTIQGRYAYVVKNSANTLQIFDVSNPASPTSVGSVATGTGPRVVTVQGRYAYVTNQSSNTLQIFDVSNPASPTSVGSVATGTGPLSVTVQGRYAYVTTATANTLQIFDVSNPASPTSVGSVATATGPASVTVQGRYAYVVSQASLQIFDVSNPASPTSVGSVSTGNYPNSVTVQGRYAYVVNYSSSTLQIFDVSNPASPTSVGSVATGTYPETVSVQGRYAYVVNASSNTLQIFDIGGTYTQSLEAGSFEVSNVAVQQTLTVNQSASIIGGLQAGSLEVNGNAGVQGNLGVNGSLVLYNSTNTNTVTLQSGATSGSYTITLPTAIGTAGQCLAVSSVAGSTANLGFASCGGGGSGHAKKIILTPEYAGAVLDGSSDAGCAATNGTMTSGYATGLTGFGNTTQSYYKWQNGVVGNQCYDIVVQVPVPSDFSSWASSTPITINTWTSDTTNGLINLDARDTSGTAEAGCSYVSVTPASTSTWTTAGSGCTLAGTYTAGSYMTLRIRMTAPNGGSSQVGNIVLNYNSSY